MSSVEQRPKSMSDWKSKKDGDLIAHYKHTGDMVVLSILFERYQLLVLGTCLKYLENREESEDASQEIFIQLSRKVGDHEIIEFKPWLYVLTKNYCFDLIRKKNRRDSKESAVIFMHYEDLLHPDEVEDEQQLLALSECLKALPLEQQRCIHSFYYESMSYIEIESLTGLSWNSIRSYIQNGRRNLKICMSKRK